VGLPSKRIKANTCILSLFMTKHAIKAFSCQQHGPFALQTWNTLFML